ncbi:conserved Plasmodium protein, unknown function [Plasmodium relictum]|uniref:Uncharacterized protein n=1 Tax=Plasmodium relictum TaxID=85471 RepID=A0A1J1H3Z4_PLARL|nr:conserved Plasmodium protein, unknown function [Plasmodium relictum]CRG99457.1 conserved Plasmodium protein, unknown function [Plasmodium relictum]
MNTHILSREAEIVDEIPRKKNGYFSEFCDYLNNCNENNKDFSEKNDFDLIKNEEGSYSRTANGSKIENNSSENSLDIEKCLNQINKKEKMNFNYTNNYAEINEEKNNIVQTEKENTQLTITLNGKESKYKKLNNLVIDNSNIIPKEDDKAIDVDNINNFKNNKNSYLNKENNYLTHENCISFNFIEKNNNEKREKLLNCCIDKEISGLNKQSVLLENEKYKHNNSSSKSIVTGNQENICSKNIKEKDIINDFCYNTLNEKYELKLDKNYQNNCNNAFFYKKNDKTEENFYNRNISNINGCTQDEIKTDKSNVSEEIIRKENSISNECFQLKVTQNQSEYAESNFSNLKNDYKTSEIEKDFEKFIKPHMAHKSFENSNNISENNKETFQNINLLSKNIMNKFKEIESQGISSTPLNFNELKCKIDKKTKQNNSENGQEEKKKDYEKEYYEGGNGNFGEDIEKENVEKEEEYKEEEQQEREEQEEKNEEDDGKEENIEEEKKEEREEECEGEENEEEEEEEEDEEDEEEEENVEEEKKEEREEECEEEENEEDGEEEEEEEEDEEEKEEEEDEEEKKEEREEECEGEENEEEEDEEKEEDEEEEEDEDEEEEEDEDEEEKKEEREEECEEEENEEDGEEEEEEEDEEKEEEENEEEKKEEREEECEGEENEEEEDEEKEDEEEEDEDEEEEEDEDEEEKKEEREEECEGEEREEDIEEEEKREKNIEEERNVEDEDIEKKGLEIYEKEKNEEEDKENMEKGKIEEEEENNEKKEKGGEEKEEVEIYEEKEDNSTRKRKSEGNLKRYNENLYLFNEVLKFKEHFDYWDHKELTKDFEKDSEMINQRLKTNLIYHQNSFKNIKNNESITLNEKENANLWNNENNKESGIIMTSDLREVIHDENLKYVNKNENGQLYNMFEKNEKHDLKKGESQQINFNKKEFSPKCSNLSNEVKKSDNTESENVNCSNILFSNKNNLKLSNSLLVNNKLNELNKEDKNKHSIENDANDNIKIIKNKEKKETKENLLGKNNTDMHNHLCTEKEKNLLKNIKMKIDIELKNIYFVKYKYIKCVVMDNSGVILHSFTFYKNAIDLDKENNFFKIFNKYRGNNNLVQLEDINILLKELKNIFSTDITFQLIFDAKVINGKTNISPSTFYRLSFYGIDEISLNEEEKKEKGMEKNEINSKMNKIKIIPNYKSVNDKLKKNNPEDKNRKKIEVKEKKNSYIGFTIIHLKYLFHMQEQGYLHLNISDKKNEDFDFIKNYKKEDYAYYLDSKVIENISSNNLSYIEKIGMLFKILFNHSLNISSPKVFLKYRFLAESESVFKEVKPNKNFEFKNILDILQKNNTSNVNIKKDLEECLKNYYKNCSKSIYDDVYYSLFDEKPEEDIKENILIKNKDKNNEKESDSIDINFFNISDDVNVNNSFLKNINFSKLLNFNEVNSIETEMHKLKNSEKISYSEDLISEICNPKSYNNENNLKLHILNLFNLNVEYRTRIEKLQNIIFKYTTGINDYFDFIEFTKNNKVYKIYEENKKLKKYIKDSNKFFIEALIDDHFEIKKLKHSNKTINILYNKEKMNNNKDKINKNEIFTENNSNNKNNIFDSTIHNFNVNKAYSANLINQNHQNDYKICINKKINEEIKKKQNNFCNLLNRHSSQLFSKKHDSIISYHNNENSNNEIKLDDYFKNFNNYKNHKYTEKKFTLNNKILNKSFSLFNSHSENNIDNYSDVKKNFPFFSNSICLRKNSLCNTNNKLKSKNSEINKNQIMKNFSNPIPFNRSALKINSSSSEYKRNVFPNIKKNCIIMEDYNNDYSNNATNESKQDNKMKNIYFDENIHIRENNVINSISSSNSEINSLKKNVNHEFYEELNEGKKENLYITKNDMCINTSNRNFASSNAPNNFKDNINEKKKLNSNYFDKITNKYINNNNNTNNNYNYNNNGNVHSVNNNSIKDGYDQIKYSKINKSSDNNNIYLTNINNKNIKNNNDDDGDNINSNNSKCIVKLIKKAKNNYDTSEVLKKEYFQGVDMLPINKEYNLNDMLNSKEDKMNKNDTTQNKFNNNIKRTKLLSNKDNGITLNEVKKNENVNTNDCKSNTIQSKYLKQYENNINNYKKKYIENVISSYDDYIINENKNKNKNTLENFKENIEKKNSASTRKNNKLQLNKKNNNDINAIKKIIDYNLKKKTNFDLNTIEKNALLKNLKNNKFNSNTFKEKKNGIPNNNKIIEVSKKKKKNSQDSNILDIINKNLNKSFIELDKIKRKINEHLLV